MRSSLKSYLRRWLLIIAAGSMAAPCAAQQVLGAGRANIVYVPPPASGGGGISGGNVYDWVFGDGTEGHTLARGTISSSDPTQITQSWSSCSGCKAFLVNIDLTGSSGTLIEAQTGGSMQFQVDNQGNTWVHSLQQNGGSGSISWTGNSIKISANGSTKFEFAGHSSAIGSGFGTSPAIFSDSTGTTGYVTVGTGGTDTTGAITSAGLSADYACFANDDTTLMLVQAKPSPNTITLSSATPWGVGDVLKYFCILPSE